MHQIDRRSFGPHLTGGQVLCEHGWSTVTEADSLLVRGPGWILTRQEAPLLWRDPERRTTEADPVAREVWWTKLDVNRWGLWVPIDMARIGAVLRATRLDGVTKLVRVNEVIPARRDRHHRVLCHGGVIRPPQDDDLDL